MIVRPSALRAWRQVRDEDADRGARLRHSRTWGMVWLTHVCLCAVRAHAPPFWSLSCSRDWWSSISFGPVPYQVLTGSRSVGRL